MSNIYKLPAARGEIEAILEGSEHCTIRPGNRNTEPGYFIFQETGVESDEARHLKVHLDAVRPTLMADITEEEIRGNGMTPKLAAEVLCGARGDALDAPGSDALRVLNEGQQRLYSDQKIAFMFRLRNLHPQLNLDWNSKATVLSFSQPIVVQKRQADNIVAARTEAEKVNRIAA